MVIYLTYIAYVIQGRIRKKYSLFLIMYKKNTYYNLKELFKSLIHNIMFNPKVFNYFIILFVMHIVCSLISKFNFTLWYSHLSQNMI